MKVWVREAGQDCECEVVHSFSYRRVIVDYRGIYVLADRIGFAGIPATFELSGVPADQYEAPVLKSFVDKVKTETTVTKDDS